MAERSLVSEGNCRNEGRVAGMWSACVLPVRGYLRRHYGHSMRLGLGPKSGGNGRGLRLVRCIMPCTHTSPSRQEKLKEVKGIVQDPLHDHRAII